MARVARHEGDEDFGSAAGGVVPPDGGSGARDEGRVAGRGNEGS